MSTREYHYLFFGFCVGGGRGAQGRQGKALISSPSSLSGSQALHLAPRPGLPSVISGSPALKHPLPQPPEAGAKGRLVSFGRSPLLSQMCRFSAWLHTL